VSSSPAVIDESFRNFNVSELLPARYSTAPSQPVAAVRAAEGGRELVRLKWGWVPLWAGDKKLAPINAMAETAAVLADKPLDPSGCRSDNRFAV
jgi:putative SOS response-associated peptidase YedK